MPDPHPPRPPGFGLAARHDVPARVDPVVAPAGRVDQPRRFLDRPALDEPGRVEQAVRAVTTRIEGAAGHDRKVVAGGQDVTDVEAARLDGKLAVREPADLAVGAVHAEPGVDVTELLDDLVED